MPDYYVVDQQFLDEGLTAISDAIRDKSGSSDPLTFPDGMVSAVEGISGGGGSEPNYLPCVTSVQFNNLNLFGVSELSLTFPHLKTMASMFQNSAVVNTTLERLTVTIPNAITNINAAFYDSKGNSVLRHITINADTSTATYYSSVFLNLKNLQIIDGTPLSPASAPSTSNVFGNCNSLVEVRFQPLSIKKAISFNVCSLLSDESIQSIIDGLSDLTGSTALTVTFHTNVVSKLTESQLQQISAKNWQVG